MQAAAFIIHREDTAAKPIVHCFFADKVALLYSLTVMLIRQQTVFHQLAVVLVLLIVAVSFGIVQTCVHVPGRGEVMVKEQLVVLLHVVVCLVFVVVGCAVVVGIHISAGVVTATVLLHFFFAGIVPGMVGAFFAAESYQLDRSVVIVISALQVVRVQSYRCAVNVSVRTDVGQAGIKRPMVVDEPCTHFHRLLVCVERAVRTVQLGIRLQGEVSRLHVDAGSERSCTIGGGSCAALYLHVFDGRCEVGQVHPEYVVALGIVDGNTVGGDVDACSVRTAHSQCRITDAGSGVTGGDGGRCHAQQVRQVLAEVLLFELVFVDVGKRHRGSPCGTCGDNLYFLQVYDPQAVLFLCLCTDIQRCHKQTRCHCILLHLQF